jgi:hypothetical protein
MDKNVLVGLWRYLLPLPGRIWRTGVGRNAEKTDLGLEFMTPDHHRVRNFAVAELPKAGKPLSPAAISQKLELPMEKVVAILDELERHMTFLYRNERGEVTWAYPVTVAQTPHRLTFSSGEQVNAA